MRILTDRPLDGWIIFDKIEIYLDPSGTGNPIFSDGFEDAYSWVVTPETAYPATTMQRTGQGPAAPVEGYYSFFIGNVGGVALISPRMELQPGAHLSTSFWANVHFQEGTAGTQFKLVARYVTSSGSILPEQELWSTTANSSGWQEITIAHQAPANATEMELHLRGAFFRGWIAVDNVAVIDAENGPLASWDFNTPPAPQGWSVQRDRNYPAGTGYWGEDLGHWSSLETPQPTGGYLLTNEGGGQAQTGLFPATAGETYHLRFYVRGEMAATTPAAVRLYFYDEDTLQGQQTLWSATQMNGFGVMWLAVNATFTIPPNVTAFQIALKAERLGGWLALDGAHLANLSQPIPVQAGQDYELSALIAGDVAAAGQESAALVVVAYNAGGQQLAATTVWGGVDYSQTPPALQSGSFTTPPGTASLRVGLAASVDNDVADGWLLFDRVRMTALSKPLSIVPGQFYDLSASVLGELDGPAGEVSGRVAAHFYDSQDNLLAVSPIWQVTDYNQPAAPQTVSGSISHATATRMRVGLMTALDEGWLAFDTVKLSTLSQPIPADGSQEFHLAAQLAGELGSASGGRLFLRYNGGAPVSVWQNTAPFSGNQNVNHAFTPPAGTFRIGTEVVLDKGHLAFSNLTLSALSAAIPHSGPQTYSLAARVNGVLASANGGRLFVRYNTGTMIDVWQNMGAFSGSQTVSGNFTPTSGVSSFQVGTEVVLDKGHLTFSDVTLTAVSAAITARPGQFHDLFAQVSGQLNSANGGRLFVKYSNGTIGYEWRNTAVFNGSQNISGNFTTPSGISSFQVGTEVVLDKGHLTFSSVTLAAYSDPIAVTAGQEYEITAQVSGSVQAGQGQGGQMVLLYGSTSHTFWQNPANFNGAAQAAYAFTAEPGISTVRLKLVVNLDAGYLEFGNVGLGQQLTPATTAYRSLYSVAGQNIGQRLKEESSTPQLVDTFSDGDANGWTAAAGTWSIQNTGLGYAYQQTNTGNSATNSHRALTQNGMSRYRWRMTFQSANRKAGLYFFASDPGNSQYHGYAYSVWQTETQLQLCENTPTGNNCNGSTDFPAANGGTHLYEVVYDPATGRLDLWRDGVYALSRQDSTPLTDGNHIAFKTQNSSVQFDDVRVTTFSNQLHYFFSDHLGSTSAIRYPNGSVTQTKYLPFGGYRGGSGGNPITDRGYTGHKHNDSLGLIYMNARYYSPYINRFISADTIVPNPTNPQQYNRYSYALNNALKYIDPSGHNVDCSPVAGDCPPSPPKPIKVKKNALDRLIQVNTWTNQMLLWPVTSVGAGTIQIHNSFSHMLETVPKPAALTANKVSAGLAIATGMFSQAEIVQRTQNGELTSNQAWKQTGVNGLSTATTTYLGAGGMATGATTLTGTLQGTTILGTPVVSAASPVVLTVVGVTSLAYVAPIAQGTANNMIEGQSFLPAFLDARSNFHHAVIGEELSVRLDEQIEFFAGPVIRGIGDTIIWGGNKLQKVGSQGP